MRAKWLMGLLALVMLSIGACARQPSTSVPQDAKRDGGVAPDVPGLSLLEEQIDLGSGQGAGPLADSRAARRRAASREGHVHLDQLLPGSAAVARPALLPVQHTARAVQPEDPGNDWPESATVRLLGRLRRPALDARAHPESLSVQDGEGTLRGAPRGLKGQRGADPAYEGDRARVGRLLSARPAARAGLGVDLGRQLRHRPCCRCSRRRIGSAWCSTCTTRR